MSAKFVVGLASVSSAIIITIALIMVGVLFQDINSLYNEVISEMDEFKVLSNDAWNGMQRLHSQEKSIDIASTIFGRQKRQYNTGGGYSAGVNGGSASGGGGQCNCGQRASRCPRGPPGPAGLPGVPGEDGHQGQPGILRQSRLNYCF